MKVEGLFAGGGRRRTFEKKQRCGGREVEMKKKTVLTVTDSAISSAIESSSRCARSAAEPSLFRDARTAATLRETSESAARLRSSAAAPAREAAEAISRSATAGTRAGARGGAGAGDEVGAAPPASSAPPDALTTRAHRTSAERESTSVAQSASMEAGVRALIGVWIRSGGARGRFDARGIFVDRSDFSFFLHSPWRATLTHTLSSSSKLFSKPFLPPFLPYSLTSLSLPLVF